MASLSKALILVVLVTFAITTVSLAQEAPAAGPASQMSSDIQQAFSKGLSLLEAEKYAEAIEQFEQVTQAEPDYEPGFHFLGRAQLADALAKHGDLAPALQSLLRAKKLEPRRRGTSLLIGKIYEASGNVDEALRAYRDELRIRSREDVADIYNAIGRVYVNAGDMNNAQKVLQHAIDDDPNYVEARYNLGRALIALGDYQGAVKMLLRARKVLEEWDSKKRRLDILAEQQKRDPKLTEEIVTEKYGRAQHFAEDIGGWPMLNKTLGDAYDGLNDYASARNAYRASMALTQRGNETDPDAHTRIGLSYLHEATELLMVEGSIVQSLHMFDAAIDELQTALQYDANYAAAYDGLGQVYMIQALNFETDVSRNIESHSLEEAKKQFQKALDLRPNFPPFLNDLGLAAYHNGDYDEAIQNFQAALNVNPNYADAHANLASAYVAKGQYEDAIEQGNLAVALARRNATAHIALGLVYYYTDDIPKAIIHFNEAIAATPRDYKPYLQLGNCYYVNESWHRAREAYRKALERLPGIRIKGTAVQRAYIYYLIGQTFYNAYLYDEAIRSYNEALAIDPSYYDALVAQARAYVGLNRYRAAQRALNTALQLSPSSEAEAQVHKEMGQMYEQEGQIHQAIAEYTRCLQSDPNNLEAQRALQRLQL